MLIDRRYYRWDGPVEGPWPTASDVSNRDLGHRLFASWRPVRLDGTPVRWAAIASGRYDAEIDAQAARIRAFGAPIYLSFDPEPEGELGKGLGQPAAFRRAWSHLVERFRADEVRNVSWILVLTTFTFSRASGRNPLDYYPGDADVDAVGVDGYNWFGCRGEAPVWLPFGTIFKSSYAWIHARSKPMVIAEWGSVEDPAHPGRKAGWFERASIWLQAHRDVKALTYFHEVDRSRGRNCDWTVDTSPESMAAFAALAAAPYFNPPSA